MFTLRTIFQTGIERNNYLGKNYEIITREQKEEFEWNFEESFKMVPVSENDRDCVYAFVITPDFSIPLYSTHKYYVVTEKGKTFGNLSYSAINKGNKG